MLKLNPKFDKIFFLMFSGCMFGFGMLLVVMYVFLTAYFSEAKATISYIDKLGEANIEFFMIFMLLGFFVICIVYGLKRIFNKENKNETQ